MADVTAQLIPLFHFIYESEKDYVWKCLRRLGVPERDLEDVGHDVFVVVHKRLPGLDMTRPLKPWLFAVAFRVAGDFRRKASNAREVLDDPVDPPTSDPSPEQKASDRERLQLVYAALGEMEKNRRAIFIMHELDGHSIPSIAQALELNENTAYSRLRLGRQEFVRAVGRLKARAQGRVR